ncbi:hypothetical protein C8J57DRAFT_1465799 [Mycena rebaudengoi]|nr:hypothetical protein C8J57DRAFT_1465799 [Mycena rebaudengoi]
MALFHLEPDSILDRLRNNILPSDLEIVQIKYSLRTARARLSVVTPPDAAETETLRQYISYYSSLIAPIRKIPAEILSSILLHPDIHTMFHMSGLAKLRRYEVHRDSPHAASVSHYWRSVLLDTPQFWASLDFERSWGPCCFLYLERSRTAPLSLRLHFTTSLEVLKRLLQDTERWKDITVDSDNLPPLIAARGRLKNLEKVTVYDSTTPLNLSIFEGAPRLRSLAMQACDPAAILSLPCSQIRTLALSAFECSSWGMLQSFPSVTMLTIKVSAFNTPSTLPDVLPMPHRNIRTLHIIIPQFANMDVIRDLCTPRARRLQLTGPAVWKLAPMQLFLERSGGILHELILDDIKLRATELVSFLRILPTLTSLVLADMPAIAVSESLFKSLLVTDSEPALLPSLTRIALIGSQLGTTNGILTMLESRARPHSHCSSLVAIEIRILDRRLTSIDTR